MKTYVTVKSAAEKYNLEPEKLQELIDQGDVHTILFEGQLIISEDDVRTCVAERDEPRTVQTSRRR